MLANNNAVDVGKHDITSESAERLIADTHGNVYANIDRIVILK